jgi:uncharacterized protein YciI
MHPPRDDFAATMTDEGRAVWGTHFERLKRLLTDGVTILAGPTLGSINTGIHIFEAPDEQTARRIMEGDPLLRAATFEESCAPLPSHSSAAAIRGAGPVPWRRPRRVPPALGRCRLGGAEVFQRCRPKFRRAIPGGRLGCISSAVALDITTWPPWAVEAAKKASRMVLKTKPPSPSIAASKI